MYSAVLVVTAVISSTGLSMQEMLDDAVETGIRKVVLPKGRVEVEGKLRVRSVKDLVIEGIGTTLVFSDRDGTTWSFDSCQNITLRGFTIDYDLLPFIQGRITGPIGRWSAIRLYRVRRLPGSTAGRQSALPASVHLRARPPTLEALGAGHLCSAGRDPRPAAWTVCHGLRTHLSRSNRGRRSDRADNSIRQRDSHEQLRECAGRGRNIPGRARRCLLGALHAGRELLPVHDQARSAPGRCHRAAA